MQKNKAHTAVVEGVLFFRINMSSLASIQICLSRGESSYHREVATGTLLCFSYLLENLFPFPACCINHCLRGFFFFGFFLIIHCAAVDYPARQFNQTVTSSSAGHGMAAAALWFVS